MGSKAQLACHELRVRGELRAELNRLNEGGYGGDVNRITALEDEMRQIEEEKCRGYMIRSRAKYVVEGERCTVWRKLGKGWG